MVESVWHRRRGKLVGSQQMNEEENKQLIRLLLLEAPAWSNRKIARVFDCDVKLAANIRADMVAGGEPPRVGPDADDVDEDV